MWMLFLLALAVKAIVPACVIQTAGDPNYHLSSRVWALSPQTQIPIVREQLFEPWFLTHQHLTLKSKVRASDEPSFCGQYVLLLFSFFALFGAANWSVMLPCQSFLTILSKKKGRTKWFLSASTCSWQGIMFTHFITLFIYMVFEKLWIYWKDVGGQNGHFRFKDKTRCSLANGTIILLEALWLGWGGRGLGPYFLMMDNKYNVWRQRWRQGHSCHKKKVCVQL